MILQNFINFINIVNISLLFFFLFIINIFFLSNNIRNKFFLFNIILYIFICIGLFYSLDGIIMLFTMSELAIILIFITMYSQLFNFTKTTTKYSSFFFIFIILSFNFTFYNVKLIHFINFYSTYSTTINDFYYIFNCYFEKHILLTTLIIFIITLYSIYFILFYFNLKKLQNIEILKIKNLNLLRKQNLIHQNNYLTKIRIFQK